MIEDTIGRAAAAIDGADALLIAAGAGMGVDSGLPDFRGDQGFWKAYPPYAQLGLRFAELANPRWFATDPRLAWGFYGHRRNLYRGTTPHGGFAILKRWVDERPRGGFVLTSNIDGQFLKAGFDADRQVEVHGAIDWMQCYLACGVGIFPAGPEAVEVDETTFRAVGPLPACPACGALARPNVLMFGDSGWEDSRSDGQERRMARWLNGLQGANLVIVELGAGLAVATIRRATEEVARRCGGLLIRINPRDVDVPRGHIGLPLGAKAALEGIDARRGRPETPTNP